MNRNEILDKIIGLMSKMKSTDVNLSTEEIKVEMTELTLKDGTKVTYDKLEVGGVVLDENNIPYTEGNLEMEDGSVIEIKGGKIASITAAVPEPAMQSILPEETVELKDYTTEERKTMADNGQAMPDGSFPIANKADLQNAISTYGLGGHPILAKKHIEKRAKELGAEDMLPANWASLEEIIVEQAAAPIDTTSGTTDTTTAVPTIEERVTAIENVLTEIMSYIQSQNECMKSVEEKMSKVEKVVDVTEDPKSYIEMSAINNTIDTNKPLTFAEKTAMRIKANKKV